MCGVCWMVGDGRDEELGGKVLRLLRLVFVVVCFFLLGARLLLWFRLLLRLLLLVF